MLWKISIFFCKHVKCQKFAVRIKFSKNQKHDSITGQNIWWFTTYIGGGNCGGFDGLEWETIACVCGENVFCWANCNLSFLRFLREINDVFKNQNENWYFRIYGAFLQLFFSRSFIECFASVIGLREFWSFFLEKECVCVWEFVCIGVLVFILHTVADRKRRVYRIFRLFLSFFLIPFWILLLYYCHWRVAFV